MGLPERIFTRALRGAGAGLGNSQPGAGYSGSGVGRNAGSTNPGKGRAGRNPVAATRSITYNSPGQPQPLDIASDQLSQEDYLYSIYVMRCVRLIAETLAASPYVAGPDPFTPSNYDTSAPLARLLGPATPQAPGGPNPHLSSRAFWIWTVVQYITSGRFAWELQWDGTPDKSDLIGLWPLVSVALAPLPIDGRTEIWSGFQYQTPTGFIQMSTGRVCYAWRPSITDWRMPESVLQSARNAIYLQRAIDKYMVNLLKNNMVATTMVVAPPFEEADQRRAWEDQFLSEYTGVDRVGGTIFGYAEADEDDPVGKPLVQVERIATTPIEAGLTDLSKTAKDDICVVPGTGIVTKRGVVPVEDVLVGDEVVTHRGRWRKVTATMVNRPSAPVLELQASGLEPLRLTGNHPVYAARYTLSHSDTAQQFRGHRWIPAGDLRAKLRRRDWDGLTVPVLGQHVGGDLSPELDISAMHQLGRRGKFTLTDENGVLSVNSPSAHPVPSTVKLTPALGRLLGLYLAEGSTNAHQVIWYLHEDEVSLHRQIAADVMEVFGAPVTVIPAAEGKCVRVALSSTLAVPVFKGGTAKTKRMPEWAWHGDQDFLREVLWGWIQGDGSEDGTVTRGFTASRSLAWHMRLIAVSLGHRAAIRAMRQTPSRIYGRDIAGGSQGWTVAWSNTIEASESHGFTYRIEDGALTSPLRAVVDVAYDGPVYNLSVEEDESYLTTGGTVHNCIAIGTPRSLLGDASQRIYANCADDQTEILTEDGWRRHTDIGVGTSVLTLNHRSGLAEWQPIAHMNRYDVTDEPMLAMTGRDHDSLTTAEHRWPVLIPRLGGAREWQLSQHLAETHQLITAASVSDLPAETKWSDEMVELVAWHWTEGHVTHSNQTGAIGMTVITQSATANPAHCDRIRSTLHRLFGAPVSSMKGRIGATETWTESLSTRGIWHFKLSRPVTALLETLAPARCPTASFIRSLTRSQLELFIDVSLCADGWRTNAGSKVISQSKPERLDGLELATILSGRTPHRWQAKGGRQTYFMSLSDSRVTGVPRLTPVGGNDGNAHREWVPYTGTVWCPTVHNSTWMARRNGRVYFTGNSGAEYRNFWTITMLNIITEIQDHVNLRLAPRVDPSMVGWFDLSKVEALQPPSVFMPPDVAEAIQAGILDAAQAADLLGIPAAGQTADSDTQTVMVGEEAVQSGAVGGRAAVNMRLREWGFRDDIDVRDWVQVKPRVLMNAQLYQRPEMRRNPQVRARPRIRAYEGVRQADEIRARVAGLRAVALAKASSSTVHRYLAKTYPEDTLGWVDQATWDGPTSVPLADVQMGRRPGGRDMAKVDGIANAIGDNPDGPAAAPVVLVRTPSGKIKVADGYHRTLAHKRIGHKNVPAYVGDVDSEDGPWDREMHDRKLNRALPVAGRVITVGTRDLDTWYGVGGTSQPAPPATVNVKTLLEKQVPYVVEDYDQYNGTPNHVIEAIADALATEGPNDDLDEDPNHPVRAGTK